MTKWRFPVAVAVGVLMVIGVMTDTSAVAGATSLGSGTYSCSPPLNAPMGTVTFVPAWSDSGTGTVRAKVSLVAGGCSGGSPTPTRVTVKGKFTFANGGGDCSSGIASVVTLKLTYQPKVRPSALQATFDIATAAAIVPYPTSSGITGSYPVPNRSFPNDWAEFFDAGQGTCASGISKVSLYPSRSSEFSAF